MPAPPCSPKGRRCRRRHRWMCCIRVPALRGAAAGRERDSAPVTAPQTWRCCSQSTTHCWSRCTTPCSSACSCSATFPCCSTLLCAPPPWSTASRATPSSCPRYRWCVGAQPHLRARAHGHSAMENSRSNYHPLLPFLPPLRCKCLYLYRQLSSTRAGGNAGS